MKENKEKIQNLGDLKISFNKTEKGKIDFSISSGNKLFNNHFIHSSDPFVALNYWLWELIIPSNQPYTFVLENEEKESFTFNFLMNTDENTEIFTIIKNYETPKEVFSIEVSRIQLIETFKETINSFVESDKYIKNEWEIISLYEKMLITTEYNKSQLLDYLLNLSSSEIHKKFIELANYPVIYKKDRENREDFSFVNGLPNLFDTDSIAFKTQLIEYSLKFPAGDYIGNNITEIIDNDKKMINYLQLGEDVRRRMYIDDNTSFNIFFRKHSKNSSDIKIITKKYIFIRGFNSNEYLPFLKEWADNLTKNKENSHVYFKTDLFDDIDFYYVDIENMGERFIVMQNYDIIFALNITRKELSERLLKAFDSFVLE